MGLKAHSLPSSRGCCLRHRFGFWTVDKGFLRSSSLLSPPEPRFSPQPPLSSACLGLSTSLYPRSPPDGIGDIGLSFCLPCSVLTTRSPVPICHHEVDPFSRFAYTSHRPWLALWSPLVNTTLFYVSTCFCLVWFIHLLCFCWFVFRLHIGVKSYGICFSLFSLSIPSFLMAE